MQVEGTFINGNSILKDNTMSYHEYTQDALHRAINDIIKIEGYVTYSVNNRILNSSGDSFMGAVCEVDIQGKTVECDKRSNVFIKVFNPDHKMAFIDVSLAYNNELYVYQELSTIYASLQEEFNVPLNERYRIIKFYNGCSQDVLPLENMREQGFVTYHRTEILSLDFIELALIALAKFHALSFVLEHKRLRYFEEKIKNMRTVFKFNEEWDNFITAIYKPVIKFLDKDIEKKLVHFFKNFAKRYSMYIQDENCIRCLCHGDYKSSNILMKNVDGVVLQVIPIDYQTIFYGCPVVDLIYLIFVSTDREFRRKHLSHLKDLYYDTLKTFLGYFNMPVETVYPRKEFERVFKKKLDFGFMISLIFIPILFGDSDMQGLNATEAAIHEPNNECKRRQLGVIEELLEWGY